ncbi:MAG: SDR family oxidoreductase [Chloroflexota bacterium]|nr:MAG: 2-deoxy-D-gluconate 3-dehydrogenase [Chloroflexota bacterium]
MCSSRFSLDGKVALVTGSARGLGRGLALGLAEAGADVVLLDRILVDESAEAIESLGRRCCTLQTDLVQLDTDAAREIIRNSVAAMGRLDILVNNAGVIHRAPAGELVEAMWTESILVNLTAPFLLSREACRGFAERGDGGKVINVASMLSFQGGQSVAAYAASKSGLVGLTRALATEYACHAINVNAIAPGYIETELTSALRNDRERSRGIRARIPAGRWGRVEDVQGAAVFLASAASDYIHGAIIPIDGGWLVA